MGMWPTNALTERLNLKYPILQAPMGSASTPALAAAVTNAGGLGGLGMWARSAEQAARRIAGFRQQSGGSLNVNYPIWPDPVAAPDDIAAMRQHLQTQYDAHGAGPVPEPRAEISDVGPDHIALMLETKPDVVSFHFGLPEQAVIDALKSAGIFITASATTVAEARVLERRGVDAIIAQGTEAGGHRSTFTGVDIGMQPGLMSLLPQVVDAVGVPVIAAGGIADGRTSAAAFMLGASAVQVGTAFLRCEEADVRDAHRAALAEAGDASTVVTNVISGRECRYIRNAMIDDLVASGLNPLPVPAQQSLTQKLAEAGDPQWTALTAGQSAALARATTAAEFVERLAEDTTQRLRAFA
jgi:nitronate monooxygenase